MSYFDTLVQNPAARLDLRIEVEERVDAHAQLRLDLLPASFQHMHGDMRFIAVLQRYGRLAHLCYLVRREQPHSIHQRQICHSLNSCTKAPFESFSPAAHLH